MKLQILVPHYNEPDSVMKPLLDSIALQQNVDFSEMSVIIVNDGSDVRLSEELLSSYPFKAEFFTDAHRGVSATRNACLDRAVADYVMFCDADDMFWSPCGLWLLFNEMEKGFDSLVSVFVEETRDPTGSPVYITHDMDSTFVHGKVHRREYLLEQGIRFNDALTIHEDSYFNILVRELADPARVVYCPNPFYLWRWRDASVCRHDPKYILKTYTNMLDSNDALVDEFIRRRCKDKAVFYALTMIFDAYYTMSKPEWMEQDNAEYRAAVELRFGQYYRKHRKLWAAAPLELKMQVSNGVRSRLVGEGMLMETTTIDAWLRRVSRQAAGKGVM